MRTDDDERWSLNKCVNILGGTQRFFTWFRQIGSVKKISCKNLEFLM